MAKKPKIPAPPEGVQVCSRKDLRSRGWSKADVKRVLPGDIKPDYLRPPEEPGQFPIPVFTMERIAALESQHGVGPFRSTVKARAQTGSKSAAAPDLVIISDRTRQAMRDVEQEEEPQPAHLRDRRRDRPTGGYFLGRPARA